MSVKFPAIQWHPVTRQRWARFRGMRRGWWSFWLLLGAYGLSLGSEWIANDRPLWIRFEGRHYFPVAKFYPEDAFTGNGRMTRPDYKALAASEAFAPGRGNRMLWPLIPHGPLESQKPDRIVLPDVVTVKAVRQLHVASADVEAEGRVVRTAGDAGFFGLLAGAGVPAEWPEEIREGMAARFENRAAGPVDVQVQAPNSRPAWVSLSPYEPRERAPAQVRLTFREELEAPAVQTAVVDGVHPVYPRGFPEPGTEGWTVRTEREQVRFPFRPVSGHPLGIDSSGRDVAARMLYALRTSLSFGMALVLATMVLGTVAGALQGYHGGKVDLFGQRFIEVWESLPFIYVLILLGSVYGQSFLLLLGVYAVFNWIGISYYMRAEFLRLRKLPFVEAARVIGLPTRKILFRHMLPNALVPLVTFFPFSLVGAIGVMAALDYLGFGLPPPTPSWGELLSQAQEFPHAWWLVLYPALALFATMLAGVFVGESLRAAFDPRTYGRME
jgi:microcin C transport system permease protein